MYLYYRFCLISSTTGDIEIKTVVLHIYNVPDEKAKTVSSKILQSANLFQVSEKIIDFLADNAPINFGALSSNATTGNFYNQFSLNKVI